MSAPAPDPTRPPRSVNGVVLVVALVAIGMGIGSIYYRWKAPPLIAELRKLKADLPAGGEALLDAWMLFGAPMIHARLTSLRLSRQQPWLVTHLVLPDEPGELPEVWGLDLTDLPQGITTRTGMQVEIRLPAARPLARTQLVGDNAARVQRYRRGEAIPDPDRRAEDLVKEALRNPGNLLAALERDVQGATLTIRVGEPEPDGGGR